jgi:hypothetical protein
LRQAFAHGTPPYTLQAWHLANGEAAMTKANVVLAAAAMIFGVGCLVLCRELSTERNRVLALEAQVAKLQHAMKLPEPAAPDPALQTAMTEPAATVSNAAVSTPTANHPPANATTEREIQRQVNADPAYRAIRLAERRSELLPEYPQLAADLGLATGEAERFLDLLAEQSLRETEEAMKKPSGDPQERRRKLFEQQEQERQAFLGEQRFQLWREYVNSTGARALVRELRTQLASTGSPLRDEQVKPLVKALAAEQQRHWADREQNHATSDADASVEDRVAYMERRATLVEESMARSKEAGAQYLDSTQQRILDAMLDRQSKRARAEVASWRTFWEADERARVAAGSR